MMTDLFVRFMSFFAALPVSVQFLILSVLFIIVLAAVFFAGMQKGSLKAQIRFKDQVREGRADAVKRSRAVLGGQMAEQMAPFLPGFPCNPADVRFVGKPVDFIAFPGAAEGRSVTEILLIEVKTGNSALSAREKEIKAAVENGSMRYVEYRVQSADSPSESDMSADSLPAR